ncbi:MAG: hypothetical protein HOO06_09570 [Bdellovibrionaceae bacterium]|jgi:hypothetical protein|nr:hypothetical protein [Pseudobdellovibrionaceae bacterium]
MYSYESMREKHGSRVSQTIDSPIMVFDYFEISELFVALLVILIFGVVFYSWGLMIILLIITLGLGPVIRRRNKKGIFFHWPYRHFKMTLPGIINPKGNKKYSD